MHWLRDTIIVAGLVILRIVLPVAITVGIGRLIYYLTRHEREESKQAPQNSVTGDTPGINHVTSG
jgi:hypothetical protein